MKIHPPRNAPTRPRRISAMQPKPRPRETVPASQPAIRPITTQAITDCGTYNEKICIRRSLFWRYPNSGGLQVKPTPVLRGFLLRHAVYRTQAQNEIKRCDSDDLAAEKQSGKLHEGDGIVRVIERRDQNHLVRNVKICVAGGKALSVEINGVRHRQGRSEERRVGKE